MQATATNGSEPRGSTLLALVLELNDELPSADEVEAEARRLVNEGHVVLTGNFRGQRLGD